jgi:hypothetical protein
MYKNTITFDIEREKKYAIYAMIIRRGELCI